MAAEIEVEIGHRLCELDREQEGIDIVVPTSWYSFEALKCFLQSNNDRRCNEDFWPAIAQGHIYVIIIDLRIHTGSDYIDIINVPAMLSDQRNDMTKSGEFSDRGIDFSKMSVFIALNYLVCFVSYCAVRIVFRPVDTFGANWLDSQLPCFPGVDSQECVIEHDY
jgi:hypothetical protein